VPGIDTVALPCTMADMWTDKVPTEPGFYWVTDVRWQEPIVAHLEGRWTLLGDDRDYADADMRNFRFWSEPLKLPPPL
jgi:hypothetical protein